MAIKFDDKYDDYGDGFEKIGKSRRKFKGSEKSKGSQNKGEGDRASKRVSHRYTGAEQARTDREQKNGFILRTQEAQNIWSAIPSKTQIEDDFWADIKEGHRPTTTSSDKESRRAFITAVRNSTYFLQNRQYLNIKNSGALMKGFGACSYDYEASDDRQSTVVRIFLNELETVLPGLDQVDSFSLSHIIYSLSNLDNSDIPKSLIVEVTKKIEESPDNWSLLDLSMAFFGLRTIADNQVQDILNKVVSKLTNQSRQDIDAASLITDIKMRPPSLIKPLSDKLEILLSQSVFDHMSETALANIADAMASLPESNSGSLFNRLWSQWQRVESPAALASLLHSFTKYNDGSSLQFVKEIATKIRNSKGNFTTVDIAKCFIGLYDKKFAGLDDLLIFLTDTLKPISHQLDPQRFHAILSGCMLFDPKLYIDLYQTLTQSLVGGLEIIDPSILSSSFCGLFQKDPNMIEPLLQEMEKQLDKNIDFMGLNEVSDIFYSLTYNTSLTAQSIRTKLKQRLVTVLDANLDMPPAEAYKAFAKICYSARFYDDHLAVANNALSSMLTAAKELPSGGITYASVLSGLRSNPTRHSALIGSILDILERDKHCSKGEEGFLLRELVLLEFAGKGKIACNSKLSSYINKLQTSLNNESEIYKTTGSSTEARVLRLLQTEMPDLELIAAKYVDGIEMDIFIPKLQLNIEIDGPLHELDLVKKDNELRDVYLLETQKIRTFRVALEFGNFKTVEEIVEEIKQHLKT